MGSLYIEQTGGNWNIGGVELDFTTLVDGDGSLEFIPFTPGGITINYNIGSSARTFARDRIDALSGTPQNVDIYVIGAHSTDSVDGIVMCDHGGAAWEAYGDILVAYDTENCQGNGSYCFAPGGRKIDAYSWTILFHELCHAYHMREGDDPQDQFLSETLADGEENQMRLDKRLPTRDTSNHQGACTKPCSTPGKSKIKCFIVSAASGSPLSETVSEFQYIRDSVLRRTEIGRALCAAFFKEYYQYSPEISRALERDAALASAVQSTLVAPILGFFRVLVAYLATDADEAELRVAFAACMPSDLVQANVELVRERARELQLSCERGEAILWLLRHSTKGDWGSALVTCAAIGAARVPDLPLTTWFLLEPIALAWRLIAAPEVRVIESLEQWLARIPLTPADWLTDSTRLAPELNAFAELVVRRHAARRVVEPALRTALGAAASDDLLHREFLDRGKR